MKVLHSRSEEVDTIGDGLTVVYSLAVINNGPDPGDGELLVRSNVFRVQDKEELRRTLHEDIDRFVDLLR